MSGLTDGERDRLADLEQQLAREDPRLVARLARGTRDYTAWLRPAGWVMTVVGLLLLSGGEILKDASTTMTGVVLLCCCWVPFLLVRHTSAQPGA